MLPESNRHASGNHESRIIDVLRSMPFMLSESNRHASGHHESRITDVLRSMPFMLPEPNHGILKQETFLGLQAKENTTFR